MILPDPHLFAWGFCLLTYSVMPLLSLLLAGRLAMGRLKSSVPKMTVALRFQGITFNSIQSYYGSRTDPYGRFLRWATFRDLPDHLGYWLWPLWIGDYGPRAFSVMVYAINDWDKELRPEWMESGDETHEGCSGVFISGHDEPCDLAALLLSEKNILSPAAHIGGWEAVGIEVSVGSSETCKLCGLPVYDDIDDSPKKADRGEGGEDLRSQR